MGSIFRAINTKHVKYGHVALAAGTWQRRVDSRSVVVVQLTRHCSYMYIIIALTAKSSNFCTSWDGWSEYCSSGVENIGTYGMSLLTRSQVRLLCNLQRSAPLNSTRIWTQLEVGHCMRAYVRTCKDKWCVLRCCGLLHVHAGILKRPSQPSPDPSFSTGLVHVLRTTRRRRSLWCAGFWEGGALSASAPAPTFPCRIALMAAVAHHREH
jgi:hypothetical protein